MTSRGPGPAYRAGDESPVIWRCSGCGALVHVSDAERPLAWCSRCARIVETLRDGGAD